MARDHDLDGFLAGLRTKLQAEASAHIDKRVDNTTQAADQDLEYFITPAPNAIEWVIRPEYLGIESLYRHVRQYQIIRDFFQLRCPLPSCNDQSDEAKDCWGKGREYLESENLLRWSKSHGEDVCPSCGSTRSELIADGLLKIYNQMHLVCGMRSGKSSVAAMIGTYVEHRLINIGHSFPGGISSYFNQLPRQPFEMTFTAATEVQAADTIWARFVAIRGSSPWFDRYIRWIKSLEMRQTTVNGARPWTYEERDKYIINGFLNLKINSLNSSSSGMAGRTRVVAFIDELARFDGKDSSRSADEAYRVLENSLRTVRSAALSKKDAPWFGSMFSLSSPISESDKAMRLLRQAPEINGMYYGHYATWEFNPDQPRSMFDDDFAKDPIGAMRDFGARPPTAASPFIQDPDRFRELAIQKDLKPTATFKKINHIDQTGREYISAVVESANLSRNGERYIAFDAGASFDQFAAACAHGEWVDTPEGKQLVTVYDWVYRLLPEQSPRRDIWFDFVVKAVEKLSKYYIISRIDFDRWQSTYLIQQLRERGINCASKGTTVDMFLKFLNDVNYSKVRMLPPAENDHMLDPPFMSAQGLAFYELEHLERSPDLKKVYNPQKGERRGWNSDDVATVVVHANWMVQSIVSDISDSNSIENRLRREQIGSNYWESGAKLYRPMFSKRGW
jgi:hypothetical protein